MFIGHYAVGLASKKLAPGASLGALIAAPILLDLLWPIFLLLGWEHVSIQPSSNPFLRLSFDSYPISHGLIAVVGWATLYAALYYAFTRYGPGAVVIWIGVLSHWLMDFIVHRPDLQLYAGGSRLVGLGLWNHRAVTIAVETALFALGILIYLLQTKAKDWIGVYAFWAFVAVLLLAYGGAAFGPAPKSVKMLAIGTLGTAVLIPWAWWFDQHRELLEASRVSPGSNCDHEWTRVVNQEGLSLRSFTKCTRCGEVMKPAEIVHYDLSGENKAAPDMSATQLVEDIVEGLRQTPPSKEVCYVVLFGDRPLTAILQGNEGDILCFTQRSKAESFMQGYQRTYHCTKPLSALALGQTSELWAMLNNKAKDEKYEPPYGLVINFNYSGQPYNKYSLADLQRIGLEGLEKGLTMLA